MATFDWTEIINQAITSAAQYLLIEQDDQYGRDSYDCLQTSRDNLAAPRIRPPLLMLGHDHVDQEGAAMSQPHGRVRLGIIGFGARGSMYAKFIADGLVPTW